VSAEETGAHPLVGQHPSMLEVYKLIARVAPTSATVLVQGESGTGKEVVARALHQNGPRASGAFIAVNCAAIPENLLESELFGHERGAFTGAVTRKVGRFELAIGGTLFLDEVADMSLALQAKILRAVQEREIQRVGGSDVIPVNVRLVAATSANLQQAIADGKFREDLYYRLAIVTIKLPRLAERGNDLLVLAAYFARHFAARHGKAIRSISDRSLDLLRAHDWKGNVRELRNVMERAVVLAAGDAIRVEHFPDELRLRASSPVEVAPPAAASRAANPGVGIAPGAATADDFTPIASAFDTLAESEARHIATVLAHTGGAFAPAARILGIHRNTLTRKMKEYGM
jgi:DNA-binding NtrC family response regulator